MPIIISDLDLRKETKEVFPSLRSIFCEYVKCLDETYLIPPHSEAVALLTKYWEPIQNTPWYKNIGDCDLRAIKLYSDVHWHRVLNIATIPENERIQWALGFSSGTNPFGMLHTFNLIRTDAGLFVFDGKIKPTSSYEPIEAEY
jgi:hypothetical protein